MYSILFGVATDQIQNLIPVSISLVYRYLFDSIQLNATVLLIMLLSMWDAKKVTRYLIQGTT